MSKLLTLSRAARLVGVTRGTLQKKIKSGVLPTFEGMVRTEDLLNTFPDTKLERNSEIDRVALIKEQAFAKRIRERVLPDAEVLAARLNELGMELAQTQGLLSFYKSVLSQVSGKIFEIQQISTGDVKSIINELCGWMDEQLRTDAIHAEYSNPLVVKDSFLRIMAAHVRIMPSQQDFFLEGSDSILDAGLRAGLSLQYGCIDGSCGLCEAKVISGRAKKLRDHAYTINQVEQQEGAVLLCSNTAVTDLVIEAPVASSIYDIPSQQFPVKVKQIERLADNIIVLHLHSDQAKRLRFLAGQSVVLDLGNKLKGEYPVASCPCEERILQFHMHKKPNNPFTDAVFNRLKKNDVLILTGPTGEFVLQKESPRSIIFIAFDTGFAPIKSMIEHAMAIDTAETMYLYWIASHKNRHYLHNLCRAWADALDNFFYVPITNKSISPDSASPQLKTSKISDTLLTEIINSHQDINDFDIYIAGTDRLVKTAEQTLLDNGFPSKQLFLTHEI